MKNLVFVESPTKAVTLGKFLGKNYQVEATFGHIRDLPKGAFGVDVYHNFEPKYVIPKKVQKKVNQLVKIAREANQYFLATDPDREGEAIAWHIKEILSSKFKVQNDDKFRRVIFHEITPDAIKGAFAKPRELDFELVDAWKARRILDRIVGYKLSPLLWAKIRRGLSAGRVQSVALRLICERQEEINKFKPQEYWEIEALLIRSFDKAWDKQEFLAKLVEKNGKKINLKTEKEAKAVVSDLEKSEYKVEKVTKKEIKKAPAPPFTTSTLQQSTSGKFGYSAKRTMKIAQDLYERGLITYMRTDSVFLADSALTAIRQYIGRNFGNNFLPPTPRKYKVKSKLAQEAHEAIRPTDITLTVNRIPLTDSAYRKIYDLIWKRTVASQVKEAIYDATTVDISALSSQHGGEVSLPQSVAPSYLLRVTGSSVKFAGFLKIYQRGEKNVELEEDQEKNLPEVIVGEILELVKLTPSQHFTQPPDIFTDGTLVKDLEGHGIGRPSTYAPIISTLIERTYVERDNRKLIPTELGKTVNGFLVENFSNIIDVDFTAEMEADLDDIAQNRQEWVPVIQSFWQPFEAHLEKVFQTAEKIEIKPEETDQICPKCGKRMVIRFSKFGKFLACSGFPECKTTASFAQNSGLTCPACGGNIVARRTKKGRTFWGCSAYPKCTFASWTRPSVAQTVEAKPTQASNN